MADEDRQDPGDDSQDDDSLTDEEQIVVAAAYLCLDAQLDDVLDDLLVVQAKQILESLGTAGYGGGWAAKAAQLPDRLGVWG
jgi:hypothetical protein